MQKKGLPGIDCIAVSFGDIDLLLTSSVGPRIISFAYKGSGNIFAELPDEYLEYPKGGKFHFYGGHRLWIAPEVPAVTYAPDDQLVDIKQQPDSVELMPAVNPGTGFRKTIIIKQTDFDNIILVDHQVKNEGNEAQKIAPWAITQLKLGGTAILPYRSTTSGQNPYLPNRSLFLWPYTDIHDPRIHFNKNFVYVDTAPNVIEPLKIGIAHLQKWIAYFIDGYFFIKYSNKIGSDCALDLGAAGQCYCNNKFIEIETLGPYRTIEPEESINHREIWRIIEAPFNSLTTEVLLEFIEKDKMTDICREML